MNKCKTKQLFDKQFPFSMKYIINDFNHKLPLKKKKKKKKKREQKIDKQLEFQEGAKCNSPTWSHHLFWLFVFFFFATESLFSEI